MIKWRFNQACKLFIKNFVEQDCVVFNTSSGQTHYLNESAVIILNLLQNNFLTSSELISIIKQDFDDLPHDADLQKYVLSIINQLDSIGLIEPSIV